MFMRTRAAGTIARCVCLCAALLALPGYATADDMVVCCNTSTSECTIFADACPAGSVAAPGATSCEPNPCLGACCDAATGACTASSFAGCSGAGGAWNGGSCEPDPCVAMLGGVNSGACCRSDGTCATTTAFQCLISGGVYKGNGTVCEQVVCAQGACCSANGACAITNNTSCIATGGSYRGDGTTCSPTTCPTGACCTLLAGDCVVRTSAACFGSYKGDGTTCSPTNPCEGACCHADASCSAATRGACVLSGGVFKGEGVVCSPTACPTGACCDLLSGECSVRTQAACSGLLIYKGDGTVCSPTNPCLSACCLSDGSCTMTTLIGCLANAGLFKGHGTLCEPSPCPPVARCKSVTIDARGGCVSTDVPASAFDDGSFATTSPCDLTFSAHPSGPYGLGTTPVLVTVTDCNNRSSFCIASVTVLASDCDHNGINDFCECYWDNADLGFMRAQTPAPLPAGGQLSHIGGGTAGGARVADDFWVCAGQVHRISGFSGMMLTNSLPGLRKARLEFYEDCDGRPAAAPFFVSTKSTILGEYPAADGYTMVEYSFDLCEDALWLEGGACGRSYWVALIGLSDNASGSDVSFWMTAPPQSRMLGSVPVKADGVAGPTWGSVVWGPWAQLDECCGGCVNMVFSLRGSACKVAWENGPPDIRPATRGGTFSGAAGAGGTARTADNFVLPPCDDAHICLIEAWVWTNCIPPHGIIEISDNACGEPCATQPRVVTVDRAVDTTQTATIGGVTYRLYKLQAYPVGLTLDSGRNYWLSAVVNGGGSLNGRTLFAYNDPTCRPNGVACPIRISPGQTRAILPVLAEEWTPGTRDYAFRIAVHMPVEVIDVVTAPTATPATPVCLADTDRSGSVTVDDLFLFLSSWFVGCP